MTRRACVGCFANMASLAASETARLTAQRSIVAAYE
jgi:hypothetical protein